MGCLKDAASGRRVTLAAQCLIGRASHCTLRLEDSLVSAEHVRIRYSAGRWLLRDLGSSNGTAIDDVAAIPGTDIPLDAGSQVTIGSQAIRWTLVDASPPMASARLQQQDGTERVVTLQDGVLALPNPEAPVCQVFMHDEQGWVYEHQSVQRPASDQQCIDVNGQDWCLQLPPPAQHVATTRSVHNQQRSMRSITLAFFVNQNEEYIELRLHDNDWSHDLGARAFNETLLLLARLRLADRDEQPTLPAVEHGWIYTDELCAKLAINRQQLGQYVYHARKQAARAGVHNPGQIVERRPHTSQLRLGSGLVAIAPLSAANRV